MTREELQVLLDRKDAAVAAYEAHKPDGSIEGDIAERKLLKASTAAKIAYADALDKYMEGL